MSELEQPVTKLQDGALVKGYTPLTELDKSLMNRNKLVEELVMRVIDHLDTNTALSIDKRWLNIARTELQKGFMALNRSVAKPQRVKLDYYEFEELIDRLIPKNDSSK